MIIDIDPGAGPCFGVERAINMAEQVLNDHHQLLCIGDLIHNEQELFRLKKLGMEIINLKQAVKSKPNSVLFRAHGEAPSVYNALKTNNIAIIDTTCPIVRQLQLKIKNTYNNFNNKKGQIIIYGNSKHPEIISLLGHCNGEANIIENETDLDNIDLSLPIHLFSQTTKYRTNYLLIKERLLEKLTELGLEHSSHLIFHDSSCKTVAKRDEQLKDFIQDKDIIIFVSGKNSSNGKQLFNICKKSGITSYFVSQVSDLERNWFDDVKSVGISGATSTPSWLLFDIQKAIQEY